MDLATQQTSFARARSEIDGASAASGTSRALPGPDDEHARDRLVTSKLRTDRYLADCRELTLAEIKRFLPADSRNTAGLYALMLDYPMRPAKALRPALCISTCMALGGHLDAVLPSAAALELFHNAFLLHDDVEDGSELRRHAPTLPLLYGVPIAVNVGDGMLALSFAPLLDNVRALGVGRALHILRISARMARESVEGQMLELEWTRTRRWDITDREYLRMVHKKTGWYSFIAPVLIGAVAAGADARTSAVLGRFALLLGIAFQIQDDLLSLEGREADVGKKALDDLWEGKYTLPLLRALRSLTPPERDEALAILARPRPPASNGADSYEQRKALHDKLVLRGDLTGDERWLLGRALLGSAANCKTEQDVSRLARMIAGRDRASLAQARQVARRHAARAALMLDRELHSIPPSVHRDFLHSLVTFVIDRAR